MRQPCLSVLTGPLEWNGQALPLILDHLLGNRGDNSPGSLQFLCPTCDAQNKKTRGGANKGRIRDVIEGGYTRLERDDTRSIIRTGVSAAVGYAAAEGHATRNYIWCGNLLPSQRVPLRLGNSRFTQNSSNRNSRHSQSANQHPPHCRGRHNCNSRSRSRTTASSGTTPSHRSSGNSASVCRCLYAVFEYFNRFTPRPLLRGVDLP